MDISDFYEAWLLPEGVSAPLNMVITTVAYPRAKPVR